MRINYDKDIELYKTKKENIEKNIEKTEKEISILKEQKLIQEELIKNAQKESINIDEAINNINQELSFFGAEGFNIEKFNETTYGIKRGDTSDCDFKTLSEGEKTIISFLYFIELCKGKSNENEVFKEKIIVIDDPISSLSHIYVFNISQLIKRTFFSNTSFNQVFILTHNLYFFHELLAKSKGLSKKFFRIIKNNHSKILDLKDNEILNDYQSYWQILKDHEKIHTSDIMLANSMRNIIEHFFGFINNDSFQRIKENIEKNKKYDYFLRYIDKESHSDLNSISDIKNINPEIFKEAFKKVFDDSGYIEHYNNMIGK